MVALNLFVSPEVKNRIDTYGAAANMPIWAIVEAAILAGKPGADGIPEGWDLPGQTSLDLDASDDKELPIKSP